MDRSLLCVVSSQLLGHPLLSHTMVPIDLHSTGYTQYGQICVHLSVIALVCSQVLDSRGNVLPDVQPNFFVVCIGMSRFSRPIPMLFQYTGSIKTLKRILREYGLTIFTVIKG